MKTQAWLRLVAAALFVLVVASAVHPIWGLGVEGFRSLVSDDYKKVELCKSTWCLGGDDACVSNCFSKIKALDLCPPSVTTVDKTDERGLRWGSSGSGRQCIHAL